MSKNKYRTTHRRAKYRKLGRQKFDTFAEAAAAATRDAFGLVSFNDVLKRMKPDAVAAYFAALERRGNNPEDT